MLILAELKYSNKLLVLHIKIMMENINIYLPDKMFANVESQVADASYSTKSIYQS